MMKSSYSSIVFLAGALLAAGCSGKQASYTKSQAATSQPVEETNSQPTSQPITSADPDRRLRLDSGGWIKSGDNEWLSSKASINFPFDELIYSWDAQVNDGEGFQLYLQVTFPDGESSPWLYGGWWGDAPLEENRKQPTFSRGKMAYDQLLLEEKADSFQFKLVSTGDKTLSQKPELTVILTDNSLYNFEESSQWTIPETYILNLPHRRQADSAGNPKPDHCQTAALATALEYYGQSIPLENLIPWTYDPEYDLKGIWPRTLGAANQLGFDAYIDRFRDWERVEETLHENKIILISMTMPEDGDYIAPPYSSTGGHIIALNGMTDDGRVIVTDSALPPETGTNCQWLYQDMEKVWFKTKGGVAMVVTPPESAMTKKVTSLPEFPYEERQGN